MKLRKMMFWKSQDDSTPTQPRNGNETHSTASAGETSATTAAGSQRAATAAVIPLTRTSPEQADRGADEFTLTPAQATRVQGLMNTPELEVFFKFNHFGSGRHQGSQYRTLEALERGLEAVVAQFQNIVAEQRGRRQAKLDRLQLARQEVASFSSPMANQLALACQQTERELVSLQEQLNLAEQRKGWVLDALNRYRLGFDRGVRDALDYELLNV
jgi:hypothetical protein